MALKLSTGLVNKLMDTGSFKSIFNLSFIEIYSGTQPANADAVITGTLLATISANAGGGTGVTFEASATAGILEKTLSETWSGVGSVAAGAGGTAAGWFRLKAAGDTGVSSTTEARVDGSITSTAGGGDMKLGSVTIVTSAPVILSAASFTLPMA